MLLRVTMANQGPLGAGGPARAVPPADGRHARARGARPGPRAGEPRPGWRSGRRRLTSPRSRRGARTRFAPAPTGFLHLGHVANAIWVWGVAGATDGRVLLRIEDHDRVRSRPEYEAALLEDLAWLGFVADDGPVRQSDDDAPYLAAARTAPRRGPRLRLRLLARRRSRRGRTSTAACGTDRAARATAGIASCDGPGPAGGARRRFGALDGCASSGRAPTRSPRVPATCRSAIATGNWTYGFAVVVDDLRQAIDLVIRGRDLLAATPAQIRLARLLGRETPAVFAHHPLIRRPDGSKLSKADGDTSVRDLRAAGRTAAELIGEAAAAVGLIDAPRPIDGGRGREPVRTARAARPRTGPPSPRRGRGRARRSAARRSGRSTSARRAASRRTARAGSRACRRASPRSRRRPSDRAACR